MRRARVLREPDEILVRRRCSSSSGSSSSIVMAVGAGFAATNTMYAAVARRSREIGTLRALGFGRGSILRSFVFESVCLALIGGDHRHA